jgi:hypothetical protein
LAGGRLLTAARNFFPHPQLSVEPAGVGTFCSLGWGERPREPSLVQSDEPRPAREDQPSPRLWRDRRSPHQTVPLPNSGR